MSITKWLCSICHTDGSFPMMITNCGHTFCEECLENVESCPVCRMNFHSFDLQPNYALVDGDKQPLSREFDLDARIKDLVRIKYHQIKSQVDEITKCLLDQLHEQLTQYPSRVIYTCLIKQDISFDLMKRVRQRLLKYDLEIVNERDIERNLGSLISQEDEIPVNIRFVLDPDLKKTGHNQSGTGIGTITTTDFLNAISILSNTIPPGSATTSTTGPNASTWITGNNPNMGIYDIILNGNGLD